MKGEIIERKLEYLKYIAQFPDGKAAKDLQEAFALRSPSIFYQYNEKGYLKVKIKDGVARFMISKRGIKKIKFYDPSYDFFAPTGDY